MALFKRTPLVVEAFQWTGDVHQVEDPVWACDAIRAGVMTFDKVGTPDVTLLLKQADGALIRAYRGDWIIKLSPGAFTRRSPELFALAYEPVES